MTLHEGASTLARAYAAACGLAKTANVPKRLGLCRRELGGTLTQSRNLMDKLEAPWGEGAHHAGGPLVSARAMPAVLLEAAQLMGRNSSLPDRWGSCNIIPRENNCKATAENRLWILSLRTPCCIMRSVHTF